MNVIARSNAGAMKQSQEIHMKLKGLLRHPYEVPPNDTPNKIVII
jgi:hypothetical protein